MSNGHPPTVACVWNGKVEVFSGCRSRWPQRSTVLLYSNGLSDHHVSLTVPCRCPLQPRFSKFNDMGLGSTINGVFCSPFKRDFVLSLSLLPTSSPQPWSATSGRCSCPGRIRTPEGKQSRKSGGEHNREGCGLRYRASSVHKDSFEHRQSTLYVPMCLHNRGH